MAQRMGFISFSRPLFFGVVFCALSCGHARAADSHLHSAGPISLGYVGLYYGLVDPASGTWYVGSGLFGGTATAWLAVADTGRSACALGATTQELYAIHSPPGLPRESYPDVTFTDIGFGGSEDFAVTLPLRLMIAGQAAAGADPDNHTLYQAYGPIGGASPPSLRLAASVQILDEGEVDFDVVGMSVLEGRVLHVDPQQVDLLRCGDWTMAGSLTDVPPAPGGAGVYYIPFTLQNFFSSPQNLEVGRLPMLPVSMRYRSSNAFATRTALLDSGSRVNFVSESFAIAAGVDLGRPEDLTITVPGLATGQENRPGYYVDALALELGAGREGDRLIIDDSAVFIVPDNQMPAGLDAILGNAAFSPSAGFAGTSVGDWYLDTRNADNSSLILVVSESTGAVLSLRVGLSDYIGDNTTVATTVKLRQFDEWVQASRLTLGAGGEFSVSAPPGTYDVWVKASHWLAKLTEGVVLSGNTDIGTVDLSFNGDGDDDNEITSSDLAVILAGFGTGSGDLNGSSATDETDLDIVLRNMEQVGQ